MVFLRIPSSASLGNFIFLLITRIIPATEDGVSEFPIVDEIRNAGYPVEMHSVITEDNYILTLHRIKHGKNNEYNPNAEVVYFMHGLSSSAHSFLKTKYNLPFMLADSGYDVWLGNARGNRYSSKHLTYDSSDLNSDYWNFSFHEIGKYDLPANLNHILETTGKEKLFYIGHSQGTTSFFVMTSERPEMNERIKLMVALAPVIYLKHIGQLQLRWLANNILNIESLTNSIGIKGYLFDSKTITNFANYVCRGQSFRALCRLMLLQNDYNYDKLLQNADILPEDVVKLIFEGVSLREYYHYAQVISSGGFRQYSFGEKENLIKYGSKTPPDYDLQKITAPVALYYAYNDIFTQPKDIERTISSLPNVVYSNRIDIEDFNHLDFLFRKNIKSLMYDDVVQLINNTTEIK